MKFAKQVFCYVFFIFGLSTFVGWWIGFIDIKLHDTKPVSASDSLLKEDNEFFEIITTTKNENPYFVIQKIRDKKSGAEYTMFIYDNGGETFIDKKGE